MRKGVIGSLAVLAVLGITVALLAALSASTSKCAPGGSVSSRIRVNTLIPPGDSSASQYVENVPTARGGCPTASIRPTAGAGAVSRATERVLFARGTTGAAAALVARETGTAGSALNAIGLPVANGNRQVSSRTAAGGSSGGSSVLGAVAGAVGGSSGGGGLGALFPIILVVCAVGAGLSVLFGLRRQQS